MRLPNKLPIMRMEDYHTHYLGRSNDGTLFWGYETFVWEKPHWEIKDGNKLKYRLEYAVFHTFDSDGNYLATKHLFGGTADIRDDEKLENQIEEWVAELGETDYGDIEVKLFQTVIDGFIFGLIPEDESIDLQPSSMILFQEPWNGEYYT
jgi:formate hydrogenlyase regulatory protein HycA